MSDDINGPNGGPEPSDGRDDLLVRSALAEWPASAPPHAFAERVLAARSGALRGRTGWRGWALATAGLCGAAATALALLRMPAASGRAAPSARETLRLGARAVAVAEGGSQLRWAIACGGDVRVEQTSGDVFYRVDAGGTFVVSAAGVEVGVRGTCFRVSATNEETEGDAMQTNGKMALTALAGAAAATLAITVYEGTVQVRAPAGAVEVHAGQRAEVRSGAAPRLLQASASTPVAADSKGAGSNASPDLPPPAAQLGSLQARVRTLEQERTLLQAKVTAYESRPGLRPADAERAADDPTEPPHPLGQKMRDFNPAERAAMAKNCEVRFDLPELSDEPWKPGDELVSKNGLGSDERAAVTATVNQIRSELLTKLRAFYVEETGDANAASTLNPNSLSQEILYKARPGEVAAARKRIASELAGLVPPPDDPTEGTLPERYLRLMTTAGDSLQDKLTKTLGSGRAGKLRDAIDGWHSSMNGCESGDGK